MFSISFGVAPLALSVRVALMPVKLPRRRQATRSHEFMKTQQNKTHRSVCIFYRTYSTRTPRLGNYTHGIAMQIKINAIQPYLPRQKKSKFIAWRETNYCLWILWYLGLRKVNCLIYQRLPSLLTRDKKYWSNTLVLLLKNWNCLHSDISVTFNWHKHGHGIWLLVEYILRSHNEINYLLFTKILFFIGGGELLQFPYSLYLNISSATYDNITNQILQNPEYWAFLQQLEYHKSWDNCWQCDYLLISTPARKRRPTIGDLNK